MSQIHVFVDNSNVIGCANLTAKAMEPGVPWFAFRIHFQNLFAHVVKGRNVGAGILAGSIPPGNEDLWTFAKNAGFDTSLLQKVEKDDGRFGEQGVDEVLHKLMLETILDNPTTDTLVVVTGDGARAEHGGGFYDQIVRALKLGWSVELWSWKAGRNGKFEALAKLQSKFSIHEFDTSYYNITFVKAGTYYRHLTDGSLEYFELAGRDAV